VNKFKPKFQTIRRGKKV